MSLIRNAVEVQSGLDLELIERCSNLVHIQAFDEAVRNAFVVLEERMRLLLKKENATGFQMAQYAFSSSGPFTKLLAHNQLEHEGTRDLFFGAFRLYRNPTAHSVVGYSAGEARSILSLVNLLLVVLNRLEGMVLPGTFTENIEQALLALEQRIGQLAVSKVRIFLSRCVRLNIQPRPDAKQWIPFRRHAYVLTKEGAKPKQHLVTVFYLTTNSKEQGLWFPVKQYYSQVIGLNKEKTSNRLQELGFKLIGEIQDPFVSLNSNHDTEFLGNVFEVVTAINAEFDESLKRQP